MNDILAHLARTNAQRKLTVGVPKRCAAADAARRAARRSPNTEVPRVADRRPTRYPHHFASPSGPLGPLIGRRRRWIAADLDRGDRGRGRREEPPRGLKRKLGPPSPVEKYRI